MTTQLILIDDSERDWRIDEATREVGRRGIAEARQILHSVPRAPYDTDQLLEDEGGGDAAPEHGRRDAA